MPLPDYTPCSSRSNATQEYPSSARSATKSGFRSPPGYCARAANGSGNGSTRGKTAHLARELKHDELARLPQPAAIAAHKLGIPAKDAVEIFRKMLRAPSATNLNDGDER